MAGQEGIGRREVLQMVAAAGLYPALSHVAGAAPDEAPAGTAPAPARGVPLRRLGKTGVDVPLMALGNPRRPEVMALAMEAGFTFWDTSISYEKGENEKAIGNFFKANKGTREKVFLSTKPCDIATPVPNIPDLWKSLETSLKNLQTDHVEVYLGVHAMPKPDHLTDGLRKFAEDGKKKGLFRFFGFSSHANIAENLAAAARLNWIDMILAMYNYRNIALADPKLEAAIDACHKANIGLVGIKAQGLGAKPLSDAEKKLTDAFAGKGLSMANIKTKMVLEDPRFTGVSVGMFSVEVVQSCIKLAHYKKKLTNAAGGTTFPAGPGRPTAAVCRSKTAAPMSGFAWRCSPTMADERA